MGKYPEPLALMITKSEARLLSEKLASKSRVLVFGPHDNLQGTRDHAVHVVDLRRFYKFHVPRDRCPRMPDNPKTPFFEDGSLGESSVEPTIELRRWLAGSVHYERMPQDTERMAKIIMRKIEDPRVLPFGNDVFICNVYYVTEDAYRGSSGYRTMSQIKFKLEHVLPLIQKWACDPEHQLNHEIKKAREIYLESPETHIAIKAPDGFDRILSQYEIHEAMFSPFTFGIPFLVEHYILHGFPSNADDPMPYRDQIPTTSKTSNHGCPYSNLWGFDRSHIHTDLWVRIERRRRTKIERVQRKTLEAITNGERAVRPSCEEESHSTVSEKGGVASVLNKDVSERILSLVDEVGLENGGPLDSRGSAKCGHSGEHGTECRAASCLCSEGEEGAKDHDAESTFDDEDEDEDFVLEEEEDEEDDDEYEEDGEEASVNEEIDTAEDHECAHQMSPKKQAHNRDAAVQSGAGKRSRPLVAPEEESNGDAPPPKTQATQKDMDTVADIVEMLLEDSD